MYYWTLDTLTLSPFYARHEDLIKELNLDLLQKKVFDWARKTKEKYPALIKVPPLLGVKLLKFKCFCGGLIKKFKHL